ncbi:hypothetical protein KJS94_02270 [Flavihumibacter rivuli]|uniref:hypothetical protein n=1 Tax=Flavihumibacter rivuli TaxID=2838156 RepID=UPI001BDDD614|nr:hypothetical protein [Flavihumibacter rivuli]ULQ57021.1 hypothetical protein KJS94_02270 [Flavihumibacter rivuli]
MHTTELMEAQLWEYIDGLATSEERSTIEQLIATNIEWRRKYEELLLLNNSLSSSVELEEPSMRFTRNVMEEISKYHIAPAAKSYINKKIIYGIAGFMLTIIVGALIYAIGQIDWSAASSSGGSLPFDLSKVDTSKVFNNNYLNAFMIVNIVAGLMLLDQYLSQQKKQWKDG